MTAAVEIRAVSPQTRVVACKELGMVVYTTTATSARTVRRLMYDVMRLERVNTGLQKMLRKAMER